MEDQKLKTRQESHPEETDAKEQTDMIVDDEKLE